MKNALSGLAGMLAVVCLGGLASVSAGEPVIEPVKTVPPPKYWDHYLVMPWQTGHSVLNAQADYEALNLHGFHVDRRNSKAAQLSKDKKWLFYVDHAADKGYLHLRKDARYKKISRKRTIVVRPNSLADPVVMKKMKGFLDKNIAAAKGAYPVAYALDDEISTGSFTTPVETDGHPASVKGYRKFLADFYDNDIAKLNKQYGSSYASFDAISPKSFESFRAQVKGKGLGRVNLSQWCDWRSYMDTQFARVLGELVRHCNKLDPNVPCGFVGGCGPAAFGGYDWRKLCKTTQWCEAYNIGANNEIIRSFWGQERPLLKTFFFKKGNKHEGAVWRLWYFMCHGNRGIITWPADWFKGGLQPHVKKLAPTFKEIQGPVSKLIMDSEFQYDPVAIYYSHPSVQVTWAMDSAPHGKTWPNRSSSMDLSHSTSNLTRLGWCKALEDVGIQARFYHVDHLLSGQLQKDGMKVLILNRSICLSDAEANAIKKFHADGGTVIADHLCGIMDEHGKARSKGALADLFGVKHDLTKGILDGKHTTEVNCERGYRGLSDKNWIGGLPPSKLHKDVAVFELGLIEDGGKAAEKAGGTPVMVKKGRAIYMNLSTIGYYKKRPSGAAKAFPALLRDMLKDAGVTADVSFSENGKPAMLTESIMWKKGEKMVLCVFKNINVGANVNAAAATKGDLGSGQVKLGLTFARPVKDLKNERTGKALGNGKTFEDTFTTYEANVYSFSQ